MCVFGPCRLGEVAPPFALTGRGWGVGKRVLVSAKSEESPLALTGKQKEPPHALLVSAKGGGAGRPGR